MPRYTLFALAILVFSSGCISLESSECVWDTTQARGLINNITKYVETPPYTPVNFTTRVLHEKFYSSSLHDEKNYAVVLPPDYFSSISHYPVVYLLNGMCGNETSWLDKGDLLKNYDELLATGSIHEMIIAMPDGDNSAYENGCSGALYKSCGNYEDYIVKDFVAEIDAKFRTLPDRSHRAIGGLSNGAEGAMRLALLHSDVFSSVASHSGNYNGLLSGLSNATLDKIRSAGIHIYFDTGTHIIDSVLGFVESNNKLDSILTGKNIQHEFHAINNLSIAEMHDWSFWKTQIRVALQKQSAAIS
ncbi:MAG: alpha/beta hydrolase-fold protein [Candidatus Aenigmatarchaeota archaeon]